MNDLADVLRRTTQDLAPHAPDLLLSQAVRRGAGLRRRRRIATVSSVVGATAAACAIAVVTLGLSSDTQAAPAVTVRPSSSAPTLPSAPPVSIRGGDLGVIFAQILPGVISHDREDPPEQSLTAGEHAADFDWNGYRASVQIAPYAGTSRAECQRFVGDRGSQQTCVRVAGGWLVHEKPRYRAPDANGIAVLLDNGFRMWVLINNSGEDKGSSTGGPVPLGVQDLVKVATSPLWFR